MSEKFAQTDDNHPHTKYSYISRVRVHTHTHTHTRAQVNGIRDAILIMVCGGRKGLAIILLAVLKPITMRNSEE